jgi:hypothetical protein
MHTLILAVFLFAIPMTRVTSVRDGRTILVDGSTEVRLAGVEVTDELHARELLRWTVNGSWVLIERLPDGTALVYRSPDALFVNRELVLRGFARATLPGIEPEQRIAATYHGTVNLGVRATVASPAPAPRVPKAPRPRSTRTSRPKAGG